MKLFNNMDALILEINQRLKMAVDIIADKIYEQLKINISLYTYGYPEASPNTTGPINQFYENVGDEGLQEPSYEFRDEAWVKTKAREVSRQIVGSIYFDGNKMSPPTWFRPYTHGNFYSGEDRRMKLAELLNVTGVDSENDWGGKERKPFFDITIEWIETNWQNIAKKALKQVGLNVQ